MKESNGVQIIELDDHVVVFNGSDWGVSGVVIGIAGEELTIWGRLPSNLGSKSYRHQVNVKQVLYIGKGKIRPPRPGETIKRFDNVQAAAVADLPHGSGSIAPPSSPESEPGFSDSSQQQPASPPVEEEPEPLEPPEEPMVPRVAPPAPPPVQEEIKPELLKTEVFRRPSAADAHHLKPQQQEQQHAIQERTDLPPTGKVGTVKPTGGSTKVQIHLEDTKKGSLARKPLSHAKKPKDD